MPTQIPSKLIPPGSITHRAEAGLVYKCYKVPSGKLQGSPRIRADQTRTRPLQRPEGDSKKTKVQVWPVEVSRQARLSIRDSMVESNGLARICSILCRIEMQPAPLKQRTESLVPLQDNT